MQLALTTIIAMPLLAVIIDHFSETVNLAVSVIGFVPLWKQILVGLLSGTAIAVCAQFIISRPFMKEVNMRYSKLLEGFKLSLNEILFVSVCAGIGEEILFRGALQPLFGIVFVAFLFVAIHGYLNPRDWRITIYGLFMTGAMCALGFAAKTFGLLPAIIAHTVIDVYLLNKMMKSEFVVENPGNTTEDPTSNPIT